MNSIIVNLYILTLNNIQYVENNINNRKVDQSEIYLHNSLLAIYHICLNFHTFLKSLYTITLTCIVYIFIQIYLLNLLTQQCHFYLQI